MPTLHPQPLTASAFAPYGDVIETAGREYFMINNGTTRRYHHQTEVALATAADRAIISLFRAQAAVLPLRLLMLERHPLGSQAFIPLQRQPFLIVVAPPGAPPQPHQVEAFISNGRQGINYHRGVWHHPLLSCAAEDEFLVIDRLGAGSNCDEHYFSAETALWLEDTDTDTDSGPT